jgi:hypothetical protein
LAGIFLFFENIANEKATAGVYNSDWRGGVRPGLLTDRRKWLKMGY